MQLPSLQSVAVRNASQVHIVVTTLFVLALLPPQVASGVPSEQLASTLVPIVRCAAHSQLSLPFVTTADRHILLLQLMETEDPAVAVLAAEAWCRCVTNFATSWFAVAYVFCSWLVSSSTRATKRYSASRILPAPIICILLLWRFPDICFVLRTTELCCRVCGEADLQPWADTLLPAVPPLLSIISSNTAPEARKVPLLFFAMSSLVRMATVPAVAQAVRQQGGLSLLVSALHVVPAAICQVS